MKRMTFDYNRALKTLIGVAALTLVGCNSEVNFNPLEPSFPLPTSATLEVPVGAGRDLEITGTLRAEQGAVFEATVLYDGVELEDARAVCQRTSGCATLRLTAFAESSVGDHTISFQALRQSTRAVPYVAQGTVRVLRDGVFLGGVSLPLGPHRARLRAGESVSFNVSFQH